MFDKILQHEVLYEIRCSECFENGIGIEYDTKLLDDYNEIDTEKVLILCIDEYYNTRKMQNPPPSIDCLVIVKCDNGGYGFHLVELRNVKSPSGVKRREIVKKFNTTVEKFMQDEFGSIFMDETFIVNDFKLYLITDACRIKKMFPSLTEDEYRAKMKDSSLSVYQSLPPFLFRGQVAMLTPCAPDYVIKGCL